MSVKSSLAALATGRWALPTIRRLCLDGRSTIFTLHRFAHPDGDPDGDPDGMSAAALDDALDRFRGEGFEFVALDKLISSARLGEEMPRNAIAFTVDDGYFDFAEVAMPVFARHHCPVTMFLVTGFIDGQLWMWWDKIAYMFDRTQRQTVEIEELQASLDLADRSSRREAAGRFSAMLKGVSTGERLKRIDRLARVLAVDLPHQAPHQYRPMTWDQVRAGSAQGASFGPHSVTHPILARSADHEVVIEIADSWQRVQAEVPGAVPFFAYPNGGAEDYGAREIEILRKTGLLGAVTTRPGHVRNPISGAPLYELPRWDLTPDPLRMRQVSTGLEAAKAAARQRLRVRA